MDVDDKLIRWNMAEVAKLVELTHFTKVHNRMYKARKTVPGLIFVKDQGIYLISTKAYPKGKTPASENEVAYAKGFGPNADWDVVCDAAGGDDFSELIPLTDLDPIIKHLTEKQIDLNDARLIIKMAADHFEIKVGIKRG